MGPEAPGNLVVIDLRFQDGELKGDAERVEYDPEHMPRIEEAGGWFYVLWNEIPRGEDYISLGRGVVHVKTDLPLGYKVFPKNPIQLDSLGEGRFAYRFPALGEGLMLVLIFPEGHTLAGSQPMPKSAKVFKKRRLAVYWKPAGKYGANVKVAWEIRPFFGDLRAERNRINDEIDKSENVPDNAGVMVDAPVPQGEGSEPGRRSAWANGSFYLFAFAVVIAGLGLLARTVSLFAFALILIAGILFVPLIGALQLKQDEQLSNKAFVALVKIVIGQLPLIRDLFKSRRLPRNSNGRAGGRLRLR
jgi:hypothetical protein